MKNYNVFTTMRIWNDILFHYEEWSGQYMGTADEARAHHDGLLIIVLRVREI